MVYRQFMPLAQRLYVTHVLHDFEADTFFPEINPEEWRVVIANEVFTDDKSGLQYRFAEYSRI
jgi:dihydrofolate reductase